MEIPLGSMDPPPSVSKRSKASLISRTSSSVRPGRSKALALNCLDLVLVFFINLNYQTVKFDGMNFKLILNRFEVKRGVGIK